MSVRRASVGYITGSSTRNVLGFPINSAGGTESTSGGYKIHQFTSAATSSFMSSGISFVEYLVVAAGGGAGMDGATYPGGGGAGGLLSGNMSLPAISTKLTVTVGAGVGYGNGNNSVLGSLTAIGGGAGGQGGAGSSGGSGGGGQGWNMAAAGGSGTSGQGYAGGTGVSGGYGGTGGGAGGVGSSNSVVNSLANSITGSEVLYCNGGWANANPGPTTPGTGAHSRSNTTGYTGIIVVRYPV